MAGGASPLSLLPCLHYIAAHVGATATALYCKYLHSSSSPSLICPFVGSFVCWHVASLVVDSGSGEPSEEDSKG
jgi:hypothetical protein